MQKYKVEFKKSETFVFDVEAKDEETARGKACIMFDKAIKSNVEHYNEIGDTEIEISNVYDVTNTEDPFDPKNELLNN